LIAPEDLHLLVRRTAGGGSEAVVRTAPRVCYQPPTVLVLFSSVDEAAGAQAAGVMLTRMGSDRAQGLVKTKRAGAQTLTQNEKTCVVFGLPREGDPEGGVDRVLPLDQISGAYWKRARRVVRRRSFPGMEVHQAPMQDSSAPAACKFAGGIDRASCDRDPAGPQWLRWARL
jgi:chemotaxis response regulator CheB